MPVDTAMHVPHAEMRPPRSEVGIVGWMHRNLFASWSNTLLTLVGLWIVWKLIAATLDWAVFSAVWEGADGSVCRKENAGACWPFITNRFGQFMYGRYPDAERWRVNLTLALFLGTIVPLMVPGTPGKKYFGLFGIFAFPVLAWILLYGGLLGLPVVKTELWGGLLVTLVVATCGIAGSFPVGIVLALGRRSRMPIASV